MDEPVELRRAEKPDLEDISTLLRESRLPVDGLSDALAHAVVASSGRRIVGCVALELHDGVALLRSLAVSANARGRGLGARLTREALEMARTLGTRDVYLLTETARDFFPRFGFAVEDRAAAPVALRSSVEFRSACPASAVVMHARVAR
ncbi:MAG TPA: arsenic resistance N-acetyltransferase ArsN2 [Thermoanaerobaculia bacterium]|nr:arsenic resistance N-acetyltransferase ArsN2 [Thermoanaerobaculia bacterium]